MTIAELMNKLGGQKKVSEYCRVGASTPAQWVRRNHISFRFWTKLMAMANDMGFELTPVDLYKMCSTKPESMVA